MSELTERDLNTLIEALDQWEKGDGTGMFGTFLEITLPEDIKNSPEYQKQKAEREERDRVQAADKKRCGTLLKAKLYALLDNMQLAAASGGADMRKTRDYNPEVT